MHRVRNALRSMTVIWSMSMSGGLNDERISPDEEDFGMCRRSGEPGSDVTSVT